MPIVCAVVVAFAIMLITCGLGFKKFKIGSPPVVGNCSAAVVAACHAPFQVEYMPFGNVVWNQRVFPPGIMQGYLGPAGYL
jgi:hypothetical protein